MANNLKEWKSTIVGALFLIIGLIQYLVTESTAWSDHILDGVFVAIGIGFLFAPDRLIDFLFSWAKKKTGV